MCTFAKQLEFEHKKMKSYLSAVADPGEGPPLFLDYNAARGPKQNVFETRPPYLRVWMTGSPPLLSEGLDPSLNRMYERQNKLGI